MDSFIRFGYCHMVNCHAGHSDPWFRKRFIINTNNGWMLLWFLSHRLSFSNFTPGVFFRPKIIQRSDVCPLGFIPVKVSGVKKLWNYYWHILETGNVVLFGLFMFLKSEWGRWTLDFSCLFEPKDLKDSSCCFVSNGPFIGVQFDTRPLPGFFAKGEGWFATCICNKPNDGMLIEQSHDLICCYHP